MTYYINKNEARSIARNDLTIFNEVNALMLAVIQDATSGLYSSVIADGTTMTESTPTITLVGSVANPTITGTPTFVIAGTTVTLGTTGTNLNSVIADINDAGVSGVVASKNSSNNLVITYTAPAATTWSITVGSGTANTSLGFTAGTTLATTPSSVEYYNVWQGTTTDRAKQDQMDQVISYFRNLGYTIERQINTTTGKTFKWLISY